jgi:methylmalonic aciduria homocystinuria type C protein
MSSLIEIVRARSEPFGLDLVQPFQVGWYNEEVDAAYRLPDFGRASALGLLIGNTRALWPRFIEALRAHPPRVMEDHPLDRYAAESVAAALATLPVRWEARGSHEAPPRRVAMQRLAQVSGLAWLSPSHLSVHPIYGPWLALRAAVVLDIEGPSLRPHAATACEACTQACMPAFDRALAEVDDPASADLAKPWPLWLAVRDACPIGRAHRYDDDQIAYHYTKDRRILERLMDAR